jgi:hypothetical protein
MQSPFFALLSILCFRFSPLCNIIQVHLYTTMKNLRSPFSEIPTSNQFSARFCSTKRFKTTHKMGKNIFVEFQLIHRISEWRRSLLIIDRAAPYHWLLCLVYCASLLNHLGHNRVRIRNLFLWFMNRFETKHELITVHQRLEMRKNVNSIVICKRFSLQFQDRDCFHPPQAIHHLTMRFRNRIEIFSSSTLQKKCPTWKQMLNLNEQKLSRLE